MSITRSIGIPHKQGVMRAAGPPRWLTTPARMVALGLVAAGVLLPFAWMLTASVRPESDIVANPWSIVPHGLTLSHYVDIWSQIPFARQKLLIHRRAENSEVVTEPFLGLLEETFHPLPTFVSGAVAIALNIESRK